MPENRVTAGDHRPAGSGDSGPASAAAPGSVRTREGAALADDPGRGQTPVFPDALGLVVFPSQFRLPLSASSRSLRCVRDAARRWRARGGRGDPPVTRCLEDAAQLSDAVVYLRK